MDSNICLTFKSHFITLKFLLDEDRVDSRSTAFMNVLFSDDLSHWPFNCFEDCEMLQNKSLYFNDMAFININGHFF